MRRSVLESEGKRGKYIGHLDRQQDFAEAAIEKTKGRNGIHEEQHERKEQKIQRNNRQLFRIEEDVCQHSNGGEHAQGNIHGAIAQIEAALKCLIFKRTVDFGQNMHQSLEQQNNSHTQPELTLVKRLAEIIRQAGTEGICQRGEEEMNGAKKLEQF